MDYSRLAAETQQWVSLLRREDLHHALEEVLSARGQDENTADLLRLHARCEATLQQRRRVVQQALYPLLYMHQVSGIPLPDEYACGVAAMKDLSDALLEQIEADTAATSLQLENEKRPLDVVVAETRALLQCYSLRDSQVSPLDVFILNGVDMSVQPESFIELVQSKRLPGDLEASFDPNNSSVHDALLHELDAASEGGGQDDASDEFGMLLRVCERRLEALRAVEHKYVVLSGEALQEVHACFTEVEVGQQQRSEFYNAFEALMQERRLQDAVALCKRQLEQLGDARQAVLESKRRAVQALGNEVGHFETHGEDLSEVLTMEERALDRAAVVSAIKEWRMLITDLHRREVLLTQVACETTGRLVRASQVLRGVSSPAQPNAAVVSDNEMAEDDQRITVHENDLVEAKAAVEEQSELMSLRVLEYEMQYGENSLVYDFLQGDYSGGLEAEEEREAASLLPFNRMLSEEEELLRAQYGQVKQVLNEYRLALVQYQEIMRVRDQYKHARRQSKTVVPSPSLSFSSPVRRPRLRSPSTSKRNQTKHAPSPASTLPLFNSSLQSPERSSSHKLRKGARSGDATKIVHDMPESTIALKNKNDQRRLLLPGNKRIGFKSIASKIVNADLAPSPARHQSESANQVRRISQGMNLPSSTVYLSERDAVTDKKQSSWGQNETKTFARTADKCTADDGSSDRCLGSAQKAQYFEDKDGQLFQMVDGAPVPNDAAPSTPIHSKRPDFDAPDLLAVSGQPSAHKVPLPSPLESSRFRDHFRELADDSDLLNQTTSPIAKADPLSHVPYANKMDAKTGHIYDTPQESDASGALTAGAQSHAQLTPATGEDVHPYGDAFESATTEEDAVSRASTESPFTQTLFRDSLAESQGKMSNDARNSTLPLPNKESGRKMKRHMTPVTDIRKRTPVTKSPRTVPRTNTNARTKASATDTRKMLVFGVPSVTDLPLSRPSPRKSTGVKKQRPISASKKKKKKKKATKLTTTPTAAHLISPKMQLIHVQKYADEKAGNAAHESSLVSTNSLLRSSKQRHLQCVNVELLPLPSAIEETRMISTQREMMQPLKSEFGNDTQAYQGFTTFTYQGQTITAALWRPKTLEYYDMSDEEGGEILSFIY